MSDAYRILDRKRAGETWTAAEVETAVSGAVNGDWSDAQLAAFLMAAAVRGLDTEETVTLTRAMLESGEQWRLAEEIPTLGDKHSTGGVGDKVSLVLGPLLAACGQPVVMLTGRALGHSGGTADKLETVPGLDLALDRQRAVRLLREIGLAIGVPTAAIAPADRRLYALRHETGTVIAPALVVASILSKKLAAGPSALVFDVKTGPGAFFETRQAAREVARKLVDTASGFGLPTAAWLTDMSQPLGEWSGWSQEVAESLACLRGEGPPDLEAVSLTLAEELCRLTGGPDRERLEAALRSGAGFELFGRWSTAQGASSGWLTTGPPPPAPVEEVVEAPAGGVLARVDTRGLGLLLQEAAGSPPDPDVALRLEARLGDRVVTGQPLARLYLRRRDSAARDHLAAAFAIADEGEAPPLLYERIG